MFRQVHIPAGTYMVSRSLQIKGSNGTHDLAQSGKMYYHAAVTGDGKLSTVIKASPHGSWGTATNSSNLAVVFFPSCCGPLPQSGAQFYLRDMNIQANQAADYGVLAPAVQSSLFQRIYLQGGLVGGLRLSWGWSNMIEDCEFESNYVGLLVTNAGNNVNIVNSVLVDNEVGLYLSGGMQQNIEGCVFEGNGGPAIVLFYTRATTINSNYFEGNNARPLSPRGPSVFAAPVRTRL